MKKILTVLLAGMFVTLTGCGSVEVANVRKVRETPVVEQIKEEETEAVSVAKEEISDESKKILEEYLQNQLENLKNKDITNSDLVDIAENCADLGKEDKDLAIEIAQCLADYPYEKVSTFTNVMSKLEDSELPELWLIVAKYYKEESSYTTNTLDLIVSHVYNLGSEYKEIAIQIAQALADNPYADFHIMHGLVSVEIPEVWLVVAKSEKESYYGTNIMEHVAFKVIELGNEDKEIAIEIAIALTNNPCAKRNDIKQLQESAIPEVVKISKAFIS